MAWNTLLERVIADAGVDMEIAEHLPPAPLAELWERNDLGCVFMCGWPFIREGAVKTLLAAPVPAAEWAEDRPQYCSHFIVAAGAPYHRLQDCFGHRFAFNSRDSHSGYNAPRAALAAFAGQAPFFTEVVGPFVTHQRVVEAVASGSADVAAIDSFSLLLLQRHAPGLVAGVRVLASTPPCPIPALVANAATAVQAAGIRAALLALDGSASGRVLLDAVCLRRFSVIEPAAYAATSAMEAAAQAAGYPDIR